MTQNNWAPHGAAIQNSLKRHLSKEDMELLFERKAFKHFLGASWLAFITSLCVLLAVLYDNPLIWIPAALLQGFNILGFITLLHEAVHKAIFKKRRPVADYIMGLIYAFPSAISASQFTRWHLDHHIELGTFDLDPKRAYLTPKTVKRWYKLLYMTPALFVIYSIASNRAAKNYPKELRRKINIEKSVAMLLHIALAITVWATGGFYLLFRVWIAPLFLAFPIAFTINRLGQHYHIEPSEPTKWATLINGGFFTNILQMYSNFHLEHHYLPRVPYYNLARMNKLLQPFYKDIGWQPKTYRWLLWQWLIHNRTPHTNWNPNTKNLDAAHCKFPKRNTL